MKIEIWSDIVCPFCYIGKKNFENALAQFPQKEKLEIEWKSFQLDPDFKQDPDNRTDNTERLSQKYNKPYEEMKAMQEKIMQSAKEAGIDMKIFDTVQFNTFSAHRIIEKAKEKRVSSQVEERFFKAHFTEGQNLGDNKILAQLAQEAGLSVDEIHEALESPQYASLVNKDIQEAQKLGITGVPFFVFNRKYGVSGAQAVEDFKQVIETAFTDWQASKTTSVNSIQDGESCSMDGSC